MTLSTTCFVLMQLNFKQITHYISPILTLGLRASIPFIGNLYTIKYLNINWNIK